MIPTSRTGTDRGLRGERHGGYVDRRTRSNGGCHLPVSRPKAKSVSHGAGHHGFPIRGLRSPALMMVDSKPEEEMNVLESRQVKFKHFFSYTNVTHLLRFKSFHFHRPRHII